MIGHLRTRRRRYAHLVARVFALFWLASVISPCVYAAAWSGAPTAMPCHEMSTGGAMPDCTGCDGAASLNCEAATDALSLPPDASPDLPPPALQTLHRLESVAMPSAPPDGPAFGGARDHATPLLIRPHILRI
jgi:hypothetical protein